MKLTMNSFYVQSKRKDIEQECNIRTENMLKKIAMIEWLIMNPYQLVKMLLNRKVTSVLIK